jgi:membrane protease YdiL (CAAX protease family)
MPVQRWDLKAHKRMAAALAQIGLAPLLFAVVLLAAWLFNRGQPWGGALFVCASLGLPWWDARTTGGEQDVMRLRTALSLRTDGWGLAAMLAMGYLLVASWVLMREGYGPTFLPGFVQIDLLALSRQVLVIGLLAAAEEFFFRGYLQETVGGRRWGAQGWGILTRKNLFAALLFGLAHLVGQPLVAIPGQVLGGLALGWLVERSRGSIWPAVLLHAVSNLG